MHASLPDAQRPAPQGPAHANPTSTSFPTAPVVGHLVKAAFETWSQAERCGVVWHVFPADALARRGQACFSATLRTWDQTMWLCRDPSSQSPWAMAGGPSPAPVAFFPAQAARAYFIGRAGQTILLAWLLYYEYTS